MKNIYVAKSVIHGRGLFATDDLKKGDVIGVSHVTYNTIWYQVHPIGIFYNHSNTPNCTVETEDNVNLLIADRDIYEDEELTVDYTNQSYLEQPSGDWV